MFSWGALCKESPRERMPAMMRRGMRIEAPIVFLIYSYYEECLMLSVSEDIVPYLGIRCTVRQDVSWSQRTMRRYLEVKK